MATAAGVTAPAARRPQRLPAPGEPVWVAVPADDARAAAVFLHAPGENRTGNNYLLRELADACAAAGVAAVRFDLPGCGESRAPFTDDTLDARVQQIGV